MLALDPTTPYLCIEAYGFIPHHLHAWVLFIHNRDKKLLPSQGGSASKHWVGIKKQTHAR